MVIAKGPMASPGVIGFNAPVGARDTPHSYFSDTYWGGMELGDPRLIRLLTHRAADVIGDLETLGVVFTRKRSGYHLMRPLGCSQPRLVHQANCTGRLSLRLMKRELKASGIDIRNGVSAIELLTSKGVVNGVFAADGRSQELMLIEAGAVVMATGGGGGLFAGATYPSGLVGDGYAMAFQVGAELVNMEFIQFEPCHCIYPRRLGLSTTLLGFGGQLRNTLGQRFILAKYPRGEGDAPKDVLARMIGLEIWEGRGTTHGGVFCDLRKVPARVITEDHNAFYRLFLKNGIDLQHDVFEVAPAPHTFLGGVAITDRCEAGVPGLFIAGEMVGNLHGANRLGGNAGSECYVFGAIAGSNAARWSRRQEGGGLATGRVREIERLACTLVKGQRRQVWNIDMAKVREVMAAKLGVVREEGELSSASAELRRIERGALATEVKTIPDFLARAELINMTLVGSMVAESAQRRRESRGVHFRIDYPQRNDALWQKTIGFVSRRGRIAVILRDKPKLGKYGAA